MKNLPQNQLNPESIEQFVEDGESFKAASMSGHPGYDGGSGRLDEKWTARQRADRRGTRYTILSYGTPIAWRLKNGWVIVDQTFSQTTSARHQPCLLGLRRVPEPKE